MKNGKKAGSYQDYLDGKFEDKVFFFELSKPTLNPSMQAERSGKKVIFPPLKMIPLLDRIQVKGKGLVEIRVCNGELSIYKSEQTPDDKIPKKIVKADFVRGHYVIEGYDKQKLDFMMLSNYNESNPNRVPGARKLFKLLDPKKTYTQTIHQEKRDAEAVNWCLNAPFSDVLAYAKVLQMKYVDLKEEDAIRWDMRLIAKANPDKFLTEKDKDETKKMIIVITALEKGVIIEKDNSFFWAKNSLQPIVTAPTGKDMKRHFVDFLFTNEGKEVYHEMLVELKREAPKPAEPKYQFTGLSEDQATELLGQAIDKGAIVREGNWFKHRDNFKVMGVKLMVEALQKDQELLDTVKADMNK